jgi:hypothetical protein
MADEKIMQTVNDMIFKFANTENPMEAAAANIDSIIAEIKKSKGPIWKERIVNMENIKAEILNYGK